MLPPGGTSNGLLRRVINSKTIKISRKNLLTREEIEAREVDDFLKDYKIELNFINAG
jgi:hypothetical protein